MLFRNDYLKHRRFRCLRGFMTTGLSCFDPAFLGNFIAVHRKIASMRLEIFAGFVCYLIARTAC